jgi:hypothetical protein
MKISAQASTTMSLQAGASLSATAPQIGLN